MCSTKWCYGDCDECVAEEKYREEMEESLKECPYRKECSWVNVHVKQDKCTNCGKIFNYP